jgi:hypothetical protein
MTRNILRIEHDKGRGGSAIGPFANVHLTYETGLWFLLGLAAIALRLWALDFAPLTNLEARIALDSYAITRGEAITVANPFFYGIQSILMSILGTGNLTVRLVAALAGVWICLLPLLARAQMGRYRALLFSVILTLSPTLWYASRQAEGHSLAWALAGTALLTFLQNQRRATLLFVGLLLACGQDAISPLLVVGISMLVVMLNKDARAGLKLSLTDIMSAIIAFVLASSMLLWRPSGLGDAFNGIVTWLSMLITPGNFSLLRVVSGLTVYEPLLVLSTIISIALLVIQQKFNRIDAIWIVWIVAGLLLLLIDQSREVGDMLPLVMCGWKQSNQRSTKPHRGWLVRLSAALRS